jgi:hypothetical protein
MFFRLLTVLLLLVSFPASAKMVDTLHNQKVFFVTFHKGGTHLLQKTLRLMTQKKTMLVPFERYEEFANNPNAYFKQSIEPILGAHAFSCFNPLINNPSRNFATVVLLRDPRDVVVSVTHWMHWIKEHLVCEDWIHEYATWPLEEQIAFALQHSSDQTGTQTLAQNLIRWMQDPSVLVIRFEDLVGPKGGGDLQRQRTAIKALAKHIKCPLTDAQIDQIADSIFGNTPTFREGKIGSWKNHFTPYHIEFCKEVLGRELIELGYENNNDW